MITVALIFRRGHKNSTLALWDAIEHGIWHLGLVRLRHFSGQAWTNDDNTHADSFEPGDHRQTGGELE